MALPPSSFISFLAVLCGLSFCNLYAADKNPSPYTFKVTPDRASYTYGQGEAVTFTIAVSLNGEPVSSAKINWTLSNDGKDMGQHGEATLVRGEAHITGKLNQPGFLQCRADITPPGGKLQTVRSAVAIAPKEITPSLEAPADFDAFWHEQKRQLSEIPFNVHVTPVKSPVNGVECFDLQADGFGGPLSAYLARPAGAHHRSLPAIVLTHGAGVASSRLSVAAKWASDGLLAVDFNAHGLPNDKPKDFYADLYRGPLKDYFWKGRDSREDTFFRTLYLRLQRAIDIAAAQPEWNGKELVVCGRSQGGGQALVAGGLDSRVSFVSAEIPAFCDHTGIVKGRINGWPRLIPNDADQPSTQAVSAVRYYDACHFAARMKATAFVTVGYIDVVCPPTGVYAAYNQIPGEKYLWEHLDTGHISKSEYDARVREEILTHLKGTNR